MTHESDPFPDDSTVHDEASFLAFVELLEADRRLAVPLETSPYDAPRGWQNSTIEDFLECALRWVEDSDFGRRLGLPDDASPWQRFAAFLHAGKVYE